MSNNPYIDNLIEMGYDKQDVEVASTMFQKKTFPCVIHGRHFETEEQYYAELHDYMNGMWRSGNRPWALAFRARIGHIGHSSNKPLHFTSHA